MKKALAILLVVAMAFGVFADDPAANISLANFSGSAGVTYKVDLQNETIGLTNDFDANVKFDFFTAGEKATSGDGVWGELKIGMDGTSGENGANVAIPSKPALRTAEIHFVNGDVGIALNLIKPGINLADLSVAGATSNTGVSTSKAEGFDKAAGVALEITTDPINVTFKYEESEVAKAADKKYAFGAGLGLKAVDNLSLAANFAYADKMAFNVNAGYKVAFGEEDKLYVTPGAAFLMNDDAKELIGGLLFGWGGTYDAISIEDIIKGVADGVSVTVKTTLTDAPLAVNFAVFDTTLLAGLKMGAEYTCKSDNFGSGDLALGVAYSKDFEEGAAILDASVGFAYNLGSKADKYAYTVKLTNKTLVDNTDLSLSYKGGKDNKGAITASASIHF